jgi:oligopeptide transport system permease protein
VNKNPFVPAPVPALENVELSKGTSLWEDAWHRLKKNRLALWSGIFFVIITLACIIGPWLTPYSQEQQSLSLGPTPPLSRIYSVDIIGQPTRADRVIDQVRVDRQIAANRFISEADRAIIVESLRSGEPARLRFVRIEQRLLRDRENRILSDFYMPLDLPSVDASALDGPPALTLIANQLDLSEADRSTLIRTGALPGRLRTEVHEVQLTSRLHILGTDHLGRDQLTRILQGGRISLGVGFAATFVSLLIGVVYGATAGFFGGKLEAVMMRIVDVLYALPFLIFVILLMVIFERSIWLLFLAIGAVEWLTMARIVRGQVIGIKKQEYIEAAISLGLRRRRIILKQIIPNVLGTIVVYATLTVPAVMLLEGVLSFLGLGVPPPTASWGVLINEGSQRMETSPWLLLFPGLFFSITLFCLNFLGDGLRDALDPKSSKD